MDAIGDTWYANSFGALYPLLYAHRSVEAAAPEAGFAAEQLRIQHTDRLLDLCCGNGRHLYHLRRRTPDAVGLDYSSTLLGLARESLGPAIPLVRGDMRALPFSGAFDVVCNFFTSFGYFSAPEENFAAARSMALSLKPGGRFLVDYMNAAHVERTLIPHSERELNGLRVVDRRWIDAETRRVNKTTDVFRDDARIAQFGESVRLYALAELSALLERAGLEITQIFGDYEGHTLDDVRPRMILLGRRPNAHGESL